MNILTVEDDQAIREAIAEVLGYAGYTVSTACNGQDALDQLNNGLKPDAILLDLMMPIMDGWQFIEEVNNDLKYADIPIIIVSAVASKDKVRADRPNIKELIKKPIVIDQLLKTVKEVCDGSYQSDQSAMA